MFNGTRWNKIAWGTELQTVQSAKHVSFWFFFFPPITELNTHFKDWTSIVKTYLCSPIRLPVSKKDDKKASFRRLKWDAGTQATTRPSVLLSCLAALKGPDGVITDVRYLSQGSTCISNMVAEAFSPARAGASLWWLSTPVYQHHPQAGVLLSGVDSHVWASLEVDGPFCIFTLRNPPPPK